ncbi:MAG TPA: AAA family ATPase, partial [Dehalococcoidia bacterium]|nr:AAA family ATPase [Dehalococcoidia bacterium]
MIIEKLKVKNYKSLEDVEIPLRPLTVFVGPNNSGKSNVFDCLEFVRDLALMGSQAVGIRGGFQYLIWGGDLRRAIEIELQGTVEDGEGRNRRFRYEVG